MSATAALQKFTRTITRPRRKSPDAKTAACSSEVGPFLYHSACSISVRSSSPTPALLTAHPRARGAAAPPGVGHASTDWIAEVLTGDREHFWVRRER
jgi:hypothetical protein